MSNDRPADELEGLSEHRVHPDPIVQFREWFDRAAAAGVHEPGAMMLATATPDGRPSARVVLLRNFGPDGFAFFTNYESRKARELEANPQAALAFHWPDLGRQVRVEGRVERLTASESDAYFQSRPMSSRLSAWASPQSQAVPGREFLEQRVRELEARYRHEPIPRPPFWGGYRLIPETLEFWQGRAHRLHDRLRYSRREGGAWQIERLAP